MKNVTPLSEGEASAMIRALQSAVDEDPSQGAKRVLCTIASAQDALKLSTADIYDALGEGCDTFSPSGALFRLNGVLCRYLSPAGALVLQVLGLIYAFQLIKQAASWVWSEIMSIASIIMNPGAAAAGWASTWLGTMFGTGPKAARDASSVTSSAVDVLSSVAFSTLPPGLLIAVDGLSASLISGGGARTGSTNGAAPALQLSQPRSGPAAAPVVASNDPVLGQLAQGIVDGVIGAMGLGAQTGVGDDNTEGLRRRLMKRAYSLLQQDHGVAAVRDNVRRLALDSLGIRRARDMAVTETAAGNGSSGIGTAVG